jgi:hypothetical protein
VFVSVTGALLLLPTLMFPKESEAGARLTIATGLTVCVSPEAVLPACVLG